MAYLNGHELFFGVTATVGGGSIIGTPQAASEPKSLTVTELGNYHYWADHLYADLQGLWDWDDENALTWGSFYIPQPGGNNGITLKDTYSESSNVYGGEYRIVSNNNDPVIIIKSSTAFMILLEGGAIMLFTAKDSSGTERKCVALSKNSSTTYSVYYGADDGVSANVYSVSNNNAKRTTASTYELTPFFSETADGLVLSDDIFAVRSGPTGPTGLYELAGKQFYFGYYLALKDGG